MKMTSEKRAIDKIYRRRDRYEIPDWQRGEVWPREKKQNLIDSILRGWKLPKFYLLKLSDQEYEVVDGQQRLTAIYEYFGNELPLSKKTMKEFGGEFYTQLSQKDADSFDDFEIEIDLIEDADEKELKEFFQRLQGGLPLTSSEKLNSVHSKLRDFCRKIADHQFFTDKVLVSGTRYGYFDIVAKVAAIEIEGLSTGLRFDDIKKIFEEQENFSPTSNVGKRLKTAIDFLNRAFPNNKDPLLRNRTIVQSFITFTCKLLEGEKALGTEQRVRKFFENFLGELSIQVEKGQSATDKDYLDFQRTVNANVRSGATTRQNILLRKFFTYDPMLIELFAQGIIVESGITGQVEPLARSIATLIGEINVSYSTTHGEELIKPTAKTMQALVNIRNPINDLTGYEELIDNLYFLFWEGFGARIDKITIPSSFKDINILRTAIRHDIDHGESSSIRTKRRRTGETYKKYSGSGVPVTSGPEIFIIFQVNIYNSINEDLRQLLEIYSK